MSTWKSLAVAGTIALMPVSAAAAAPQEAPLAETVAQTVDDGFANDAAMVDMKAKMQREMDAAIQLIEKLFEVDKLPPIEPTHLALAQQTMTALIPAGSLEKMLDNLYGKMFRAILDKTGSASDLMLSIKTGVESDQIAALDAASKDSIADLFDPHRKEREEQITKIVKPLISDVLTDMEPPMREGMARAYARTFSADQLTQLNGFLATPTGTAYASEWMALQADPEVMVAVMKAVPPLVTKFIDRAPQLEAQFKDVPKEKQLADLTDPELAKLAKLMKVDVAQLKANGDSWTAPADEDAMAANDLSEDAATVRDNWSEADRSRVEAAEAAYYAAFDEMDAAQQLAIDNARKNLPPASGE